MINIYIIIGLVGFAVGIGFVVYLNFFKNKLKIFKHKSSSKKQVSKKDISIEDVIHVTLKVIKENESLKEDINNLKNEINKLNENEEIKYSKMASLQYKRCINNNKNSKNKTLNPLIEFCKVAYLNKEEGEQKIKFLQTNGYLNKDYKFF